MIIVFIKTKAYNRLIKLQKVFFLRKDLLEDKTNIVLQKLVINFES